MIKMLQIPDDNPWNVIFYMCGGCGHAVKLRDVEEHAKNAHSADGVDLYTVVKDAVDG